MGYLIYIKLIMSFPRLPFITLSLVVAVGLLTGACAAPLVTGASYAADGGLLVASDKTSTDHMISMVSKQDCALWRVIKGRAVCKPREGDKDPYKVDYDDPQRTVAEDGVHYAPPLRTTADAPATSWDAAAYKTAPTAPSTPSAPVTAVAETVPGPAPAVAAAEPPRPAAPPPAAKPKKPKAHSVKKPSPRPAAPAS
jgi:hypothetical protein